MNRILFSLLTLFLFATAALAQDGTIRGRVIDEQGESLPGANVVILGSKFATVSDLSGEFTLRVGTRGSVDGKMLQVSFIGMETKRVKIAVKDTKPIVIIMHEDKNEMSEVTVVSDGYMKLPRRDMVGAYTTIKAEDIMMPSMQSIDQMLQGKVAGMVVTNPSARIGAQPDIRIRGTSTFLGNTAPLWVVDGIIQDDPLPIDGSSSITNNMAELIGNQVSWLNPQDIETITVLKDASATAIYGSKASNGVIVITTKQGSADRTSVRYSGNLSVRERSSYDMFDLMNSKERIQFSKEAYDAGARYQQSPLPQPYTYEGLMAMFNNRQISEADFASQMQFLETGNTDWLRLLTRNSISHTHNLSVSGGTQKVTYNASVGFMKGSGTEIGDDKDQITARLNVRTNFNKRLSVNFNLSGNYTNAKGYGSGVSPENYALRTARSVPAYDQGGNPVFYKNYYTYKYNSRDAGLLQSGYNIFNEMDNSYSQNKGKTISASVNISFKITDWLTWEVVGGLSSSSNASQSYNGEKTSTIEQLYRGYPAGTEKVGSEKYNAAMLPFGGMMNTYDANSYGYDVQNKFNFSHTFKEKHRINAMLAMQLRSTTSETLYNTVWGYVPERGESLVSPNTPATVVPIGSSQAIEWAALDPLYNGAAWKKRRQVSNFLSFFGILAYSYNNRYVFNVNMRTDASNRFGQDANNQFNPTYSFGFSWRMAEEGFIKDNVSWIDQMNLRATYGVQGNVVNSVSPELILSYGGMLSGYGEYYNTISSLPNPLLKWESTQSFNLGLDLMLFNCLNVNFEYYRRSSNAILNQEIAQEYGMSRMKLMGGKISNNGVELTINYTPFRTKDLAWTVGLNLSKNWNESGSEDVTANQANKNAKSQYLSGSSSSPLKKGYPIDAFWSYSFAGLDPTNGYPTFNLIQFTEADNNIDPTTFLVYSGQSTPYFTGGFNTRLRYKDFTLGIDFAAIVGAQKRLPNPYQSFSQGKIPSPFDNLSRQLNDRWKQPGDEMHTIIPALYTSVFDEYNLPLPDGTTANSRYDMWAMSDAMVADASFLRCSQITLSYNMPQRLLKRLRIGLQSLSFSATMNNVFVIASSRWRGFDPEFGGNSVQPRIYSFGLSVGF